VRLSFSSGALMSVGGLHWPGAVWPPLPELLLLLPELPLLPAPPLPAPLPPTPAPETAALPAAVASAPAADAPADPAPAPTRGASVLPHDETERIKPRQSAEDASEHPLRKC